MLCGPPCITTNKGYFLFSSKAGGKAIMLWMRLPALLVNQKWRSGCQSILAICAALKSVSAACVFDFKSRRKSSGGFIALSQLAMRIVDIAFGGIFKFV